MTGRPFEPNPLGGPARDIEIVVEPAAEAYADAGQRLSALVQRTLAELCPGPAALTIVLTGDDELHALNLRHRGRDAPTDVLSFPAAPEATEPGAAAYLGDIVISVSQAAANAALLERPVDDELDLLVVHGVLHLLGYEHDTEDGAAAMEAQERALGVR